MFSSIYYINFSFKFRTGIPIRAIGKVSIDVNGIIVREADLQSYVTTIDGRVHMAISGVPNDVGFEMQYLFVFPSVVAWLFSLHSENAYNGYQLTGNLYRPYMYLS